MQSMSPKFKENTMNKLLILFVMVGALLVPGCDTIQRTDVLPIVEQAQTQVDTMTEIVRDLRMELETLPEDAPERTTVIASLTRAEAALTRSQEFLGQANQVLAEVEASATEVGFGILEIGLSALGFGGVAGYAGAARKAARRHREQLKILEEGITSADIETLALLEPDIAKAINAPPKAQAS